MIWLVIGSSPTAVHGLAAARGAERIDRTITCNAGMLLEPRPDVYFLTDVLACRLYGDTARQAQATGTRCLTLARNQRTLTERGLLWCDEFIPNGHPYEPFQISGLWCAEHAARSGATAIVLVGMDGYRRQDDSDYFHGGSLERPAKEKNGDLLERVVVPLTRRLVAKYDQVAWRLYGCPAYRVEASNWEVLAL